MSVWVYIVRCKDGTLYTGYTTDIERRLLQHNGLKLGGPKYTSGRRPIKLVYKEKVETEGSAKKREAQIKKLSRKNKIKLIEQNDKNNFF